jgi:hypothetical protein
MEKKIYNCRGKKNINDMSFGHFSGTFYLVSPGQAFNYFWP